MEASQHTNWLKITPTTILIHVQPHYIFVGKYCCWVQSPNTEYKQKMIGCCHVYLLLSSANNEEVGIRHSVLIDGCAEHVVFKRLLTATWSERSQERGGVGICQFAILKLGWI